MRAGGAANLALNHDAIVVMGKRPSRGCAPRELEARAALATILWKRGTDRAVIVCVEGYDLPDSALSGAEVVRQVALNADVPADRILARGLSNCTAREAEAIRDVLSELASTHPIVVTHPYHLARTRRYLGAMDLNAIVIGCSLTLARSLCLGEEYGDLLGLVSRGEPKKIDELRETVIELGLSLLHTFDSRGRVERYLADHVRGSGRPAME